MEGLPRIETNLLTARLKDLEGQGIVGRAILPPSAGSNVYELTELIQSLEPVVVALSRWGSKLLGTTREEEVLRPGWAAAAVRSTLKPATETGVRETYPIPP